LLALDLKWLRNGRKDQNRPLPFLKSATTKSETTMLSHLIKTIAIVVLLAGTARGQVIPGDSPNMGVGAAVSGSRGLGIVRKNQRMPSLSNRASRAPASPSWR
jgi:hypothetical protein